MPKKTITRTRQYLCGLAICLRPQSCRNFTIIRGKNTKCGYSFSHSLKTTTTTTKNPNHQKTVFTSYAQDSQQATKRAKNLREFELKKKKREKIKKEVRKKVIDTEMSRGERRENIEEEREINIFLRKEEKEYKLKVIVNIKYGN